MPNYQTMLADYTATEAMLRERTATLRQQIKGMRPNLQRDAAQKRLYVLQEELYDVTLVRLELARREREEAHLC